MTGLVREDKIFTGFAAAIAKQNKLTARGVAQLGTINLETAINSRTADEMSGLTLYHLSEDVTDTLIADANRFAATDRWDGTLLPSESGFLVTEDGLYSPDYHGGDIGSVRVITWHAATHFADDDEVNGSFRQGTLFTFWSERGDPSANTAAWPVATKRTGPYLLPQFMHFVEHDTRVGAKKSSQNVLGDNASAAWEKATGATLTRWTMALLQLINTPTSTLQRIGDSEGGPPVTSIGSPVIVSSLRNGVYSAGNGMGTPLVHGHDVRKHYANRHVLPTYRRPGIKVTVDANGDSIARVPIAAFHQGPSGQKVVSKARVHAIRAQAV